MRNTALALEGDGELGVLPLGPHNHFARDVGLPVDLDAAVAVFADDHAREGASVCGPRSPPRDRRCPRLAALAPRSAKVQVG